MQRYVSRNNLGCFTDATLLQKWLKHPTNREENENIKEQL